jgi:hypothetical protein
MASSDTVETTAYVVLTPTFSTYRKNAEGEYLVESVRATKITQKRPAGTLSAGSVVVKVKLRLPRAVFMPLAPSVVIDFPEDTIERLMDITAMAVTDA